MEKPTCSIDGCEKKARTRGWCPMHYMRWLEGRPMDAPPRRSAGTLRDCKLCEKKAVAHDLCTKHYQAWKNGKLEHPDGVVPEVTPCEAPNCDRPSIAKKLCHVHWVRKRKGQPLDPPIEERYTAEEALQHRTEWDGDCLIWLGWTAKNGYGYLNYYGRRTEAHRAVWMIANGKDIPEKHDIDHRCFRRNCVNPEHLRAVTRSQNHQHRQGANPTNKASGVRGVHWSHETGAWMAKVTHKGRQYYAGSHHATVEAASEAARQLRNELFTHNDLDREAG